MPTRCFLAALAIASGFGVFDYLRALNWTHPFVLAAPAPAGARGPQKAERVVWVLIDGLRRDASQRMPTLERLRREGIDVAARAEFPSYSIPNYVAQACGLEPAASGVRTNGYPEPVALDSVFQAARRAGLRTGAVGTDTPWFDKYFGRWLDSAAIAATPTVPPPGALALVHLDYPDEAGHRFGAAARQYRDAVLHADAVLGEIVGTLDRKRDVLVVTSDHGHLARGGHGGPEREVIEIPIVLWGAGIAPARLTDARARDVGPTIAALLGLGPLQHARGQSLLGQDPVGSAQRAVVERVLASSGDPRARLSRARVWVLALTLALAGVLVALAHKARLPASSFAAAPLCLVALALAYHATDTVSFSSSNQQEPFMLRFALLGSLAAVLQLLVAGRRSGLPAVLVALLLCAALAVGAPERPLRDLPAPRDCFLPVLGFGTLCVVSAWMAVWAQLGPPAAGARTPVKPLEGAARLQGGVPDP
jgi:hypothetical protein